MIIIDVQDWELVKEAGEKIEKYCPITGDISLDYETPCSAVEQTEYE